MSCPSADQWRAFLDGDLPEAESEELNRHLEECEVCPALLESLAAGKETWMGTAEQLAASDKASSLADSGRLRDVMDELKNSDLDAPRSVSPESLTFLTPSENEEAIGQLGHYEILEIIGAGGMGVVLKAWDSALRRIVAIKILASHLANSASARRRFVREARAAAAVSHDHVVAIHAVEAENDPPFLVMHCVEGRTLQSRIDQDGPLELREVLRIGEQTARGLAAAHEQGIIHRDIKPSNILLENGVERVRITDFGLARAVDDAAMTQSGVLAGTPLFMAPEQAQGEPLDHRVDLFSLGSLLYAMCTGRSPFRASTIMGVIRRVCDDEPRPIREINPDVPDWFCPIVDRLLAKKPEDRFQTAEEVASLLADCLAHVQQPLSVTLPAGLERTAEDGAAGKFPSASVKPEASSFASRLTTFDSSYEAGLVTAAESAREKTLRAGRLLRWAGLLNALFFIVFELYVFSVERRELDDVTPFVLCGLLASWVIFYGGRRLSRGDSQGWPTLAAILCYLSPPGWPVGFPAAFLTQRTLGDENVQRLLKEADSRDESADGEMTVREVTRFLGAACLALLSSILFWICFVIFAIPMGLIIFDLSKFHYVPEVESLIPPLAIFGMTCLLSVFASCFHWRRQPDGHHVRHPYGILVTSVSLCILLGCLLGFWLDETHSMGYVHVRISTPGATVTLQRPGGGVELMFGSDNHQTVRIPAAQWEWHVHMGAAEPLMVGQLDVTNSSVTIFEPTIPRGRDVVSGEFSLLKTDTRPPQNNSWLRQPETVVIRDGKLTFRYDDETSQTWLAKFDSTDTVPSKHIQLTIDLRDSASKVVTATGTYSVSDSGIQLRLSPPQEIRPTKNGFHQFGQQARTTFHLERVPTLERLHGTWKPVAEKTAGREVRGAGHFAQTLVSDLGYLAQETSDALNYVWEFSGETLTSRVADKEFMSGKVLLYATTDPPRLTWVFNGPSQALEYSQQKMIYRLRRDGEGEILEVALQLPSTDFPSELESTPENGQAWIQFRRQD